MGGTSSTPSPRVPNVVRIPEHRSGPSFEKTYLANERSFHGVGTKMSYRAAHSSFPVSINISQKENGVCEAAKKMICHENHEIRIVSCAEKVKFGQR